VLAELPPAVPLVCTIQTVDSLWSGQPIDGIRQLKSQQFVLRQTPSPRIDPQTVIESRLSSLVQRFSSSGVDQSIPSVTTYHWSFDAPLDRATTVMVSGDLIIRNRQSFELNQQSRLTRAEGTRTLNTLQETATGRCVEQQ